MKPINRRSAVKRTPTGVGALAFKPGTALAQDAPQPFGREFPKLESPITGDWWHGEKAMFEGLIRIDKKTRKITFEYWPHFAKVSNGVKAQLPSWPITISQGANNSRKVHSHLPNVRLDGVANPVVQIIAAATGGILDTVRSNASPA